MKDGFLYYITGCVNPHKNLAIEQCLMEYNLPNPIIYIWQNSDTIVIGHNQELKSECRAEAFVAEGGLIARRRSGGGAVYQDLGNINVSLIGNVSSNDNNKEKLGELLKKTISSLGISSCISKRNDLLVDGKKVSGSAEYIRGSKNCNHATILINTDIDRMTAFLTPGNEKLMKNHVSSVAARVTNLSTIADIDVPRFIEALIKVSEAQKLTSFDQSRLDEYYNFYSNHDWIWKGLE